jgi:hypothetical protein
MVKRNYLTIGRTILLIVKGISPADSFVLNCAIVFGFGNCAQFTYCAYPSIVTVWGGDD